MPTNRSLAHAIIALTLLTVAARASAAAPTFDCAKASGQVEELICADEALAALDRKITENYAKAMQAWPADEKAKQRALQRGWVKGRNDCWKAGDVRTCVEESYRTRIVELQIQSGQLVVPTPVTYTCDGKAGLPFTAVFYQESDPPSAVLTYGDDQTIVFIDRSGSGARYTAANVEFWEHHGEASVDWYGTKLTCQVVKAAVGDSRFERTLDLQGVSFAVSCANEGSLNTLTITPAGLQIDNTPITREIDGTVSGAEVADIDANGSPEIYVYVQAAGSGSYGSLVAYAANNRKSLSEIYLPPLPADSPLLKGYMGHDRFAVAGDRLVRTFPLYAEGDSNAEPSGGLRELRYQLVPGEATWQLELADSKDR